MAVRVPNISFWSAVPDCSCAPFTTGNPASDEEREVVVVDKGGVGVVLRDSVAGWQNGAVWFSERDLAAYRRVRYDPSDRLGRRVRTAEDVVHEEVPPAGPAGVAGPVTGPVTGGKGGRGVGSEAVTGSWSRIRVGVAHEIVRDRAKRKIWVLNEDLLNAILLLLFGHKPKPQHEKMNDGSYEDLQRQSVVLGSRDEKTTSRKVGCSPTGEMQKKFCKRKSTKGPNRVRNEELTDCSYLKRDNPKVRRYRRNNHCGDKQNQLLLEDGSVV
ncbi:hypothetical protein V2J09_019048 [Rumex salicifolius]